MRLFAVAIAVPALSLSVHAARQQVANPTPQFKASTRLVQVSVVVRDRRNRPIEGLDRTAFQIFEDGRSQPVSFFIPAAGGEPVRSSPVDASPGATQPFTNRIPSPSNGGVVAIIFDQLNSNPSQQVRAREHLLKYL